MVLVRWMSRRQPYSEPALYWIHTVDVADETGTIASVNEHDLEQQATGNSHTSHVQQNKFGSSSCLLPAFVGDIEGAARRQLAGPLLEHLNKSVGRCNVDCGSFSRTGMQHEHSPGVVFTPQHVYIDSITPIDVGLLVGAGCATF